MSTKKNKKKNTQRKKEFQIEYLQILEETEAKDNEILKRAYDISPLLVAIKDISPTERAIKYYDDIVRLESVKPIDSSTLNSNLSDITTLWELRFLRLKNGPIPGLTLENGDFVEDGLQNVLGKDKTLTESVTCLYDSHYQLLIIEKNINLQPSGILDVLVKISQNPKLTLGIIADKTKMDKININTSFKSIEVSFANIQDLNFRTKFLTKGKLKSLFEPVLSLSKLNSSKIYINVSLNANKKDSLTQNDIVDVVPELVTNPYVNKLKIGLKEHEESNVEVINLFDTRLKGNGILYYEKNECKKHNDVLIELKSSYNSNIKKINETLSR